MTESDVALARLPQADGLVKLRPVLLLRTLPPFGDWLVCGISSQLQHHVPGFGEIIDSSHSDFGRSGLKSASLFRLGFLAVLPVGQLAGSIGTISPDRHTRLLLQLSARLQPGSSRPAP